jgi:outer membrane protein assembly factor BamB
VRRGLAELLLGVVMAIALVLVIGAGRVLGSRAPVPGPAASVPQAVMPSIEGSAAIATAPPLPTIPAVPTLAPSLPALPPVPRIRLPVVSLPPVLSRPIAARPCGADWSEYRYDSAQGGYDSSETLLGGSQLGTIHQEWFGYGLSAPPVVAGCIVYASRFTSIAAYPLLGCGDQQCSPAWSYSLGDAAGSSANQVTGSPVVALGRVLATVNLSDEGWLYAFPAAECGPSCPPLWRAQVGHKQTFSQGWTMGRSLAAPVVSGGVAFTASGDEGALRAFSVAGCGAATCQPLWTGTMGDGLIGSPAVAGGVVYGAAVDGRLYAFRATGCGAATCSPLWITDLHKMSMTTPAVGDGMVFVTTFDGIVHAIDASTGGEAWSTSTGTTALRSSPAVVAATVLVGTPLGIEAHDARSGGLLWTGDTGGTATSVSATGADGVVYAYDGGTLFAFRAGGCGAARCTAFWTLQTGAVQPEGSDGPVVVDGRLILRSEDQRLLVLS